tara:strand:- start:421 stop:642 length:222 start_codon:yes stop_codon:yes gene_type:complete
MPKKAKKAPQNYYDMKGSVDKDKKVKQSEVFGKTKSKPVPKGSHRMKDGSIMKDSDMKKPKKPTKKKTKKKSY